MFKKSILIILLIITLVGFIPLGINAQSLSYETEVFSINYFEEEYYDLKTGTLLTYENHSKSPLGYDNSYALNWVRSEQIDINNLGYGYTVNSLKNISFKNQPHYLLLWDSDNNYRGYYSLVTKGEYGLDKITGKNLGYVAYNNIDIINILNNTNSTKFAVMTNIDGIYSYINEGLTYNSYINNLPYKTPDLPSGNAQYNTVDDLFNKKGYSAINYIDYISNITINGIQFSFNNTTKVLSINGTATTSFFIDLTIPIERELITNLVPEGRFFIEQLDGNYTGFEGSAIYMYDSLEILPDLVITEFYELEHNYTIQYVERVNNYMGNRYDTLAFYINNGDGFDNVQYVLGYNYYLGDTFIDLIDESIYNSIDTSIILENGYNSIIYDNFDTRPTYEQLFNATTSYGFKNRLYMVNDIVTNYNNATGYTINTTSNPMYENNDYWVYIYTNYINDKNILEYNRNDTPITDDIWSQEIVDDFLQIKVKINNNQHIKSINNFFINIYGNDIFNYENNSYLKLTGVWGDELFKKSMIEIFSSPLGFYGWEYIQGYNLRSTLTNLDLDYLYNNRVFDFELVLNTDHETLLSPEEFDLIKDDIIFKANSYYSNIVPYSLIKLDYKSFGVIDTEFKHLVIQNRLNLQNNKNNEVFDAQVLLFYEALTDTFESYEEYKLIHETLSYLTDVTSLYGIKDYNPIINPIQVEYETEEDIIEEPPVVIPPLYSDINYGCYAFNVWMFYNDIIENYGETKEKWYFADLSTLSITINDEIIVFNGGVLKNHINNTTYNTGFDNILFFEYIDSNNYIYRIIVNEEGFITYETLLPEGVTNSGSVKIRTAYCYGGEQELILPPDIISPSTPETINQEPIGDIISRFFDETAHPTLYKVLFVTLIIIAITIVLFIYKAPWLIILVIDISIILLFALLDIVPLWVIVVIGAIIFISIILLNRKNN